MQVLCRTTNGNAEFHCSVCGQGFVLFWERESRAQRAAARAEIQETLRRHHRAAPGPQAHPQGGFLVPEWSASAAAFGVKSPGNVPVWDL